MNSTKPTFNIIITGANQGMGLGYVKTYLKRENTIVVATCRNPEKANDLITLKKTYSNLKILALDISSDLSVYNFKTEFEKLNLPYFDLLILNAGVFSFDIEQFDNNSGEQMNWMFNINAVGNYRVFNALKTKLKNDKELSKVIFVSSKHGTFKSCESSKYLGYKMCRAANNMLAKVISEEFHVLAVSIHPGLVKTKMSGFTGDFTVDEAVAQLVKVYDQLGVDKNGKFLWFDGSVKDY
jgi:NAD(P)-dependent dehydrogenase (short-subunit alcohol dehydrogenase family)